MLLLYVINHNGVTNDFEEGIVPVSLTLLYPETLFVVSPPPPVDHCTVDGPQLFQMLLRHSFQQEGRY